MGRWSEAESEVGDSGKADVAADIYGRLDALAQRFNVPL